ncbi:MAG: deoxyribodipyrimidine photo-lyase [Anaerolineae bacterium]|jgi:deoxyribodipyrimidine photo-lyase
MKTAIWWIRRDHRLTDNQALAAAMEGADQVVPAFILDPVLLDAPDAGEKRVAFMFDSLRQLDASLQARGSQLIVRQGDPVQELTALVRESGASGIWAEEDYWPYGQQRDARVAAALPLTLVGGLTVHPPAAVHKADGEPYTVFTPFSRAWKALPLPGARMVLAAPERMPGQPDLESQPLPEEPVLPDSVPFPPGEAEAWRRLQGFVDWDDPVVHEYAQARNRLDLNGTSQLSPYLRFGNLSARQAVVSALSAIDAAPDTQARKGAETWLNELIWREFYMAILHYFPNVLEQSFRANLRQIGWENDEDAFAAWCAGRTGYPVVDAAMRQLVQSGWMHNRARMVVASFLVKDLLIDWRWGERFFKQHLVDGDPASNNGGWQWTAGTGTDAAPYFRIFNPVLQSKKHDPDGVYIRRWLPELAQVPDQYLHEPWKMPDDVQQQAGCRIGQEYPAPIIDHAWARERTLAAFSQAKERAETGAPRGD